MDVLARVLLSLRGTRAADAVLFPNSHFLVGLGYSMRSCLRGYDARVACVDTILAAMQVRHPQMCEQCAHAYGPTGSIHELVCETRKSLAECRDDDEDDAEVRGLEASLRKTLKRVLTGHRCIIRVVSRFSTGNA